MLRRNAAENEPAFRKACLLEKAAAEPEWTLRAKMTQDGAKVAATITVAASSVTGEGETDKLRLHAILCERSVMAVEENGVFFHHFVARKSLTPPDGIDLKIALERPVEFAVDAERLRADLTMTLSHGDDWNIDPAWIPDMVRQPPDLDKLWSDWTSPTYVDANKLMVVAFVQHQADRRVLVARSFGLPQEDEIP